MPHPNEAELVRSLPKDVAKTLASALKADASPKRASKTFVKVLLEIGYPANRAYTYGRLVDLTDERWRGEMPVASELTPVQRTLAELLAYRDGIELFHFADGQWQLFAMPETAANRRRWLALEPPGPLERDVTYTLGAETRTEPAWRALQRAVQRGREATKEAFASMRVAERLRVIGGLAPMSYGLTSAAEWLPECFTPEGIGAEHAAWARAEADRLLSLGARETRRVRFVVFPALVRANVSIEDRYFPLLPFEPNPNRLPPLKAIVSECLGAIPDERREEAVMAALAAENDDDRESISWSMLELLPYAGVARIAIEGVSAQDLPGILGRLDALGERHEAVREVVEEHRRAQARKKPVRALARGATRTPSSVTDLTALQAMQLEVFGNAYDGRSLAAKDRLSKTGGVDDGSFTGFLELVDFVAAGTDEVLYEAILMIDSGSIFEAGTTREVAAIIQGGLDQCQDASLFAALKKVLASAPQAKGGSNGSGAKATKKRTKRGS